ncbi:MAG TPA: CHC2 zinc finger domain-containing protein, partial [bacterium]|nr:CHC2 zinc finger domain-containing protein [bacterium]
MNNNVEQIKNKLDIVEVIRDYIAVKQAGTNFKAVCPFHNEKNPSLVISPAKQIWHCFGCGKGGDVFTFVMEKEGLDFAEALRVLAAKAGVVLEQFNSKKSSERQRLIDLMALATSHFHQLLIDAKEAEAGRQYLASRGL